MRIMQLHSHEKGNVNRPIVLKAYGTYVQVEVKIKKQIELFAFMNLTGLIIISKANYGKVFKTTFYRKISI